MNLLIGPFLIFLVSLILTGLIRKYALKRSIIDIPNERSSHTSPTPRGGGASIVILINLTIIYCYFVEYLSLGVVLALAGGTIFVAIVGWLDDHKHIPAAIRAAAYALAAVWALFWLNFECDPNLKSYSIYYSLFSIPITVVSIVWLTNLYNFMDGTDALAAMESISVSLFTCFLFWIEKEQGMMLISLAIFFSSCGFLYWNWPPAKIFMGDVGSCSLGFCFGVLAMISYLVSQVPITIWIILLAIFIFDASYTLIMRIIMKEKWYKAHKMHAYQRLVYLGMSHKKLVSIVSTINILLLWPLAWFVYKNREMALYILFFTAFLMFVIWAKIQNHYYRASKK